MKKAKSVPRLVQCEQASYIVALRRRLAGLESGYYARLALVCERLEALEQTAQPSSLPLHNTVQGIFDKRQPPSAQATVDGGLVPLGQEILDGSPAHGQAPFINIKFQLGPVNEVGVNGCQIEDVLEILIRRLDGFQRGPYACTENMEALYGLDCAKKALCMRRADRERRDVEGYNAP